MSFRTHFEDWEKQNLSGYASLSSGSKGREKEEESDILRTDYQIDRDRILHSLSFRLLKHKTQVFLSTSGEVFRTRLTHTLEVASIARYIARGLDLNQDLVEAIALGHDLGHTPFGHIGEAVLAELAPFKFEHHMQSVRVVEFLEKDGLGLNLTHEVRKGISEHSKGKKSIQKLIDEKESGQMVLSSLESEVVQFADWFAYINHDIDDAFNMGLITKEDMPASTGPMLGPSFQRRLVTMLNDVISSSTGRAHIRMSESVMSATDELRDFLYKHVYNLSILREREKLARRIVSNLYEYFIQNYGKVLEEMPFLENESPERGVCDYIASLTDTRAQELFIIK